MRSFFLSRARSFRNAFSGCGFVLRTQRNAWIHASISLVVIGLSFWLRLERRDWAVIILTIALVWVAEFFNTALESVVDLVSPESHYLAKLGKDVGAAAVLIAAAGSVIVGLLILGPPLIERIHLFGN